MTSSQPITFSPIGIIHSPHRGAVGTPIQPAFARDAEGTVEIRAEFEPALADIEGFARIWLVYYLDRAGPFRERIVPYRDDCEHGLLATRAPNRPNPIGISVVRLLRREGPTLHVGDLDVLDATPLLDIKPYVPEFDAYPESVAGWLDTARTKRECADDRFHR